VSVVGTRRLELLASTVSSDYKGASTVVRNPYDEHHGDGSTEDASCSPRMRGDNKRSEELVRTARLAAHQTITRTLPRCTNGCSEYQRAVSATPGGLVLGD
jgi:hypothetical protein